MRLKITKLDNCFKLPVRKHANDVGADVYAAETVVIQPHTVEKIPLGFKIEVPIGYSASVYPRSGCTLRGIISHLPPIDPGYTGEAHAILENITDEPIEIKRGERPGQLVVNPVALPDFVEDLGEARNDGSFNSTGV